MIVGGDGRHRLRCVHDELESLFTLGGIRTHESRRLLTTPFTLLTQDRSGLRQSPSYYALC